MMSIRAQTALADLERKLTTHPEALAAFQALSTVIEQEIGNYQTELSVAAQTLSRSYDRSFFSTAGGRRVLERAMAADPTATELDLIEAGERHQAAVLGDWQLAETTRTKQGLGSFLAEAQSR